MLFPAIGRILVCSVLAGCLVVYFLLHKTAIQRNSSEIPRASVEKAPENAIQRNSSEIPRASVEKAPENAIQRNSSEIPRASVEKAPERVTSNLNTIPASLFNEECDLTNPKSIHTALAHPCLPEDFAFIYPNETYVAYSDRNPTHTTKGIGKPKLILYLNRPKWFCADDPDYQRVFDGCEYSACRFTDDHSLLPDADAVLVTPIDLNDTTPPRRSSPRQVWIAFVLESPANVHRLGDLPQWRNVFNWTMGYSTNADIFAPYSYLAFRSTTPSLKNYTSITLRKTKRIAWFVSHCETQSQRELYVKELQKYIHVDIYGACSKRTCSKKYGRNCLRLLTTTYYFYLSFENSLCKDYVTEKFFNVFFNHVDVVPIVRGGADYNRYFPRGTFINTADFSSPQNLASYLKTLAADPLLYARMLQAKDRVVRVIDRNKERMCRLCKHLHLSESRRQVYPDLLGWTNEHKCHEPDDF